MTVVDMIIDRLSLANASLPGLRCSWCGSCLRTIYYDPQEKAHHRTRTQVWPGAEECRQPMRDGTINECIVNLKTREDAT